jgi:hypothetical protein
MVTSAGGTITLSLTVSTGRRFFIEIVKGRVRRTNARGLAAAYLE